MSTRVIHDRGRPDGPSGPERDGPSGGRRYQHPDAQIQHHPVDRSFRRPGAAEHGQLGRQSPPIDEEQLQRRIAQPVENRVYHHDPSLQRHHPPNPERYPIDSKATDQTQEGPHYFIVDAQSPASPTTIDETSPISPSVGTGTGTNLSGFSAAAGAGLTDLSPVMPSPDSNKATYSLYPRDRLPSEAALAAARNTDARDNPSRGATPGHSRPSTSHDTSKSTSAPRQSSRSPSRLTGPRNVYSDPADHPMPTQTLPAHNAPQAGDVHPAHFAPYAEASPVEAPIASPDLARQGQQQTYAGQPIEHYHKRTTSGPPLRVNTDPNLAEKTLQHPPLIHQPYSYPYAAPPIPTSTDTKEAMATASISTPRLTPRTPTYNPHSLAGPNVDESQHLPGQISHPNAALEPHWKYGLCALDLVCLKAVVCPCMVYGKVQYRLSQKAQHREPTDLLGYSAFNGSCGLMTMACGFQWLLAFIQRSRLRKAYDLEGGVGSDCGTSLCCLACTLAQHEREIADREARRRQHAGPSSGVAAMGYMRSGTMRYEAPPR